MRIILNCDDLGASQTVNDSIFALMAARRVTSATLLANGPAIEDAVARVGQFPECSFGIHLNIAEFRPLSGHPGLSPLLDDKGELAPRIREIHLSKSVQDGVFAEWCAQIERALVLGVPISHLDSHGHTHNTPGLFRVLKNVQRRFSIRKVRITQNMFGLSERKSVKLRAAKGLWNYALRYYVPTVTTDIFAPFADFHACLQAGHRHTDSIELMCHPGAQAYAQETALLWSDWKHGLAKDARLISFNDL